MKKIFAWSLSLILLINFSFVVLAEDVSVEELISEDQILTVGEQALVHLQDNEIIDLIEIPIEESVEEPIPIVEPIVEPIEEPVEEPVDPPIEPPIEEPIEPPIEELIEEPVEEPLPTEEPIEEPIEELPLSGVETVYLYFSEIAWMGTEASANDEWIEIYNPNIFEVDLDGWIIGSPDSDFEVILEGVIDSESYFLLERTDDTSVADVDADQIYTGALSNDGVFLQLINPLEFVIDEVDMWHAGDNETKATMSRCDFDLSGSDVLAWCDGEVFGSPKEENICGILIVDPIVDPPPSGVNNPPTPIIEIQGDTNYMHVNVTGENSYDPDGDSVTYFWDYGDGFISTDENPKSYYYATPGEKNIILTVTDEFGLSESASAIFIAKEKVVSSGGGTTIIYQPEPTEPPKSYSEGVIVFDSALPNPDGTDSGFELIKIKNTTNETIDLKDWKIVDAGDNKKIFDSISVSPNSLLQINQADFKIILNNSDEELMLYDPAGNLIDEMSWDDSQSGQWVPNLSFLYDGIMASVTGVVDGDTFKVDLGDYNFSVRMIGIDTPETVHPDKSVEDYGIEASNYLKNLIEGQSITLEFDEDKMDVYGRLLAYVYLDDSFVNADIIKNGIGFVYDRFPFKYLDDFIRYEEEARLSGVGIWEGGAENAQSIARIQEEGDEELDDLDDDIENLEDPEGEIHESRLLGGEECLSDHLKIDSILPAPQKGEAVEYIRIINIGTEVACLNGWQLDDVIGSGSKPFSIRGGSIAGGAMRTFRKDETKLALNNSNDCASLINPNGEVADQICYGKTHKNEVFTHDGGNWVAKPRASSSKKSSSKSPKREAIAYKYDLESKKAIGKVELIYEDGELMYLTLNDSSIIQISYASSGVDVSMSKQLLDMTRPIEVQYLSGGETNQLIAINQTQQKEEQVKKNSSYFYIFLLFPIIAVVFWWNRR